MLKKLDRLGRCAKSRQRRKYSSAWVVELAKSDLRLFGNVELEKHAPLEWDVDASAQLEIPLLPLPPPASGPPLPPPASEPPSHEGDASVASLLGGRGAGVPEEVSLEMERLARSGAVPITTLKQRARNRGAEGSLYGVPPCFSLWLGDTNI